MPRTCTNTHVPTASLPRATSRESNQSPELATAAENKRSEEGRSNHKKTAKRNARRKRQAEKLEIPKEESAEIERIISMHQAKRLGLQVSKEQVRDQSPPVGIPLRPYERKKTFSKPAKRIVSTCRRTKKPSVFKPIILERRKAKAEFREIKRMFKKILKFALNQGKKYGHAFCIAILNLFCIKIQPLVLEY